MSFVNKGSMPATVTVSREPDRSGNYVCNGTADDVEIQAALTYLATRGGGEVYIGRGTYNITAQLTVSAAIHIRGAGQDTVLLQMADFTRMLYINHDQVMISDLWFEGGRNAVSPATAGHGIESNDTDYLWIERCLIHNFHDYGIYGTGSPNIWYVNRNYITENYGTVGNVLVLGSADSFWMFNQIGGGNGGIEFGSGVAYVNIIGNKIFTMTSNWAINLSGFRHINIIGNIISQRGIRLYNSWSSPDEAGEMCVISGNTLYGGDTEGIYVEATSDATAIAFLNISDNIIYGWTDGIELNTYCHKNLITNNMIKGNSAYGVNIAAATCDDNIVIHNVYDDNSSGHLNDGGTNTRLETIPLYIATYNTDSETEDGPTIDGTGEWASFIGQLPLSVQQVLKIEIWGVTNATDADQMLLEIEVEGGADNEPKTTHDTGVLANQQSVTSNFAAEDIIHWECTNAAVLALLGGDSVKCVARYNALSAPDIATNADFRRAIVHIV